MQSGGNRKAQSERTRAAILDGAMRLFAKKGFASTTTQDLSKAIGMTQGALYWHFEDKEALLVAVLEDLQRKLAAELLREAEGAPTAPGRPTDPASLVKAMLARVAWVIERQQEKLLLVGVIGAEVTDTNPRIEKALRKAYRGIASVLQAVLEEGQRAGQVDAKLDVACAAELFCGLYMGGILHQRLFRDELPLPRALPVLQQLLFAALMPGVAAKAPASGKRRRG